MGENTIEGARGAKIKIHFQRLHMTYVVFVLVYKIKFSILGTPFNIAF